MPVARPLSVVFDCENPKRLAEFWRELVGGEVDPRTQGYEWVALAGVPNLGYLAFQRVPEDKSGKNRLHLDLEVDDIDAAVSAAISLGARRTDFIVDEGTNLLQVMADPEGNEFCFILRKERHK